VRAMACSTAADGTGPLVRKISRAPWTPTGGPDLSSSVHLCAFPFCATAGGAHLLGPSSSRATKTNSTRFLLGFTVFARGRPSPSRNDCCNPRIASGDLYRVVAPCSSLTMPQHHYREEQEREIAPAAALWPCYRVLVPGKCSIGVACASGNLP
jgi:hypothetical protein